MDKAQRAALEKLMASINKEGKTRLEGDDRKIKFGTDVDPIVLVSTGFALYDAVVGGEPKGRTTIDYGPESSGKSSWNYMKIASLQRQGCTCAVADIEQGFDPMWAAKLGVVMEDLLIIPGQDSLENSLEAVNPVIKSGLVDFILLDSIHGVAVEQELRKKGKMGKPGKERSLKDDTTAAAPRKIGQFVRIVTPTISKSKVMLTVIGQARETIDVFKSGFVLTGGHALKHHASCIRQWTRTAVSEWPTGIVNGEERRIGFMARVRIEKTKLNGHEGQVVKIPFLFGWGPSLVQANVDAAKMFGLLIEPATGRFEWTLADGTVQKLHGKAALYGYFGQHPNEYQRLAALLNTHVKQGDENGSKEAEEE